MKKRLLLVAIFFLNTLCYGQTLYYGGKNFFLNGANISWKNYGWDFGDNASGYNGGNGYDPTWWENTFSAIENYKGNSVRIWVHCKGQHNPIFNNGTCTGLNANFFSNLDDLLQRAENHNLMVILCLFDFHLVDVGREDVIKDLNKTNAYITNALIPMVQRYETQCNLLAWEIINEPEWIMQSIPGGGSYGGGNIAISQMQRFVGLCASAIHKNSSKMVTVGSASLKWNSTITPAVGNYWSNAALLSATGNDSEAYLDFYQIHYYDWMNPGFSPYANTKSYWSLDKPVLIGETGNEGHYNYQQQFDYAYSNGYAGCMPWAFESGGAATWNDFNVEMQTFRNNHISIVDFDCAVLSKSKQTKNSTPLLIFTSENLIEIRNLEQPSLIEIFSIQGNKMIHEKCNQGDLSIITSQWTSGVYIIKVSKDQIIETRLLYVF